MKTPELGSHVLYHRAEGKGADRKYVSHDATVMGYERAPDHDVERDGLPPLTLAFVEPSRVSQFIGVNWTDAFEEVFSVPHEDAAQEGGHHYYSDLHAHQEKAIADMVTGIGILRKQLEEKTKALEAAEAQLADLDEHAENESAKEAADGKVVKGKKAKD